MYDARCNLVPRPARDDRPNDPKSHREFVMSSMSTAPPEVYPAPSPHGDPQLTGLRGWVGRPAFDRILGDRAWPELAPVRHTGSCLPWHHSRCQSAGGGFRARLDAVDL